MDDKEQTGVKGCDSCKGSGYLICGFIGDGETTDIVPVWEECPDCVVDRLFASHPDRNVRRPLERKK